MRGEGNSQGHKKDTNVFTGEDALDARSRTRFIVDNRKGDQDWSITDVGVKNIIKKALNLASQQNVPVWLSKCVCFYLQVVYNETGTYGTDLFTREADKVLNDHDGSKPLFLYFAQQAVHVGNKNNPLQAPQKYLDRLSYIGDEKRRTFAGIEKYTLSSSLLHELNVEALMVRFQILFMCWRSVISAISKSSSIPVGLLSFCYLKSVALQNLTIPWSSYLTEFLKMTEMTDPLLQDSFLPLGIA